MNAVLIVLFSMILAGIIGLVTNIIAISMLFRPYKTLYIGKKKLPFTPGLIPKRQKEIADHLGRTVMNHLLTAEGLEGKLTSEAFQEKIKTWSKQGVKQWIEKEERSVVEIVQRYDQRVEIDAMIENKLKTKIEDRIDQWLNENRDRPLHEVLPEAVMDRGSKKVPELTDWLFERLKIFLNSDEGKSQMQQVVRQFLERQGSLVQMLGSFVKTDRILERVYPEFVRALTSDDMKGWAANKLKTELSEMLTEPIGTYVTDEKIDELKTEVIDYVIQKLPIRELLYRPINIWGEKINDDMLSRFIDAGVTQSSHVVQSKLPELLQLLNLEEVISEQVNAFSVSHLEEIVLTISRREFRLIKYLGGVLGAIIGFAQGIVILFLI